MAFLSLREWTQATSVKVVPTGVRGGYGQEILRVEVELSPEAVDRWRQQVAAACQAGQELRLDLAEGWTVFCKEAQGPARLLVARPEADTWVATISLSQAEWDAFWQHGKPEQRHPSSNLDWVWITPR